MPVDFLVFGPHPDDAEIGCGGMLLKMKSLGYTTGIIDMTTGDMGWGDPQQRVQECEEAAKILQLDVRENLDMGDCRVEDTFENRCKVAQVIRKHRPQILFAPWYDLPIGRGLGHNDHFKTGVLVSQGYNFSHLRKMPIEGEPWQARAIFYYFLPAGLAPPSSSTSARSTRTGGGRSKFTAPSSSIPRSRCRPPDPRQSSTGSRFTPGGTPARSAPVTRRRTTRRERSRSATR